MTLQGKEAAPAICNAIKLIGDNVSEGKFDCDVILLVRGGGSLEDLWSFNEESVARAIYDCPVPIVSGVGHEVDVTIADFVADIRAATPTAAAETVTPDQTSWLQSFDYYQQRLQQLISDKTERQQEKTQWLLRRLQTQHPKARVQDSKYRIKELTKRLMLHRQSMLSARRGKLAEYYARFSAQSPQLLVTQNKQTINFLNARLQTATLNLLGHRKSQLSNVARTLNAISPLQTLERGYSITMDNKSKAILSVKQVKTGDTIETRLHDGKLISRVESCIETEKKNQ